MAEPYIFGANLSGTVNHLDFAWEPVSCSCRRDASPEEVAAAEKWLSWSIADLEAQLAELERVRPGLLGLALKRKALAEQVDAVAAVLGVSLLEALVSGAKRENPPEPSGEGSQP